MSMVSIEIKDLDKLNKTLSDIAYKFPKEVNSFMQKEMTQLKKTIHKYDDPRWNTQITHSKYVTNWEPFQKARYTKFSEKNGIKSWWILKNKMFYERFVNDGHAIRKKKRGPAVGYAKPTHHYEKGAKAFEGDFHRAMDQFVRSLFKP